MFHPFSATKAEGLVEVLRVFSEGVNNVEVLSGENLWVSSTGLGRSLYDSIQEEKNWREQFWASLLQTVFFGKVLFSFDKRAEFMSARNRRRRPMGNFLKISTSINV